MQERARKIDKNANRTDVTRALLRLPPDRPDKPELLTEEDRIYFLGDAAPRPSVTYIKLVGRVSAGSIIEPIEDAESIPVLSTDIEGVHNARALKVIGDSMVDANVIDGDIILTGDCPDPRNRIVVAYVLENGAMVGATLKWWRQKGNNVTLEPANPKYKAVTYPAKKLRLFGALIKVLRTLPKPEVNEQEAAA
jgi:SOS-response transcriptional repressor LexA